VTLRVVATLALLAGVLAGCSSGHPSEVSFTPPPGPSHAALVARAHLDPCPPSSAGSADRALPDVTLPCLGDGPAVRLAGLRGTPTVLNVWGSWCGPCQTEAPYFASAYDALKGRVRVLGVDTVDSTDSALDFAPHVTPPMRYPSVVDGSKKVLIGLRLPSAVPTTVFVDAGGHVVKIRPGPYRSEASLRADIARYLGVDR
jgi:cytochrome c biogenesis protein CcmG/thiol:disulfide interchange protein DsbE